MSWKEGFGNRGFLRFVAVSLVAAAVAVGLYACKKTDDEGVVAIGLTDTPGDFLTYTVDVTSLTLTKADNTTVVQTLPQRTRIDFAQVVDLTEFITGATIPAGTYVSATLNVDYTNADIRVDDGTGTPVAVPLTNILDTQNRQVTALPMKVTLDNARQLVIAPLASSLLDLDFNLAASNLVDMSVPASPVVTVNPLLVADVNPDSPKPHRIRGPLDSVNTQAGSFTLILRPFNLLQGDHGRLAFLTDSNTTFEIDQVNYVGSAGLSALAAKSQLTATLAIGTLDLTTRRFIATEVLAGSSVPFGTSDVLTGNVTSRSGSTAFVVKGAELVRSNGTLIFGDTVTVTVASGMTKVIKQGTTGTFATGDISVGQRVTVSGVLNAAGTTMDATNATSGLVRLLVTQLNGTVNSAGSGVVAMTLARIDGRPISLFNFSGTGTTAGNDASPISYQVAAGALSLAGITNGTPLKVRGFVQPFGQATATDDFNAITLIDVTSAPATLVVGWPSLEAAPFNSYPPGGLVVNLLNAGVLHDVFRGGVDTRLSTSDTPTVQAINPARGLFVIGTDGTVQVYTRLSTYQAALQAELAAGRKARSFVASGGTYVDGPKTLTANAMAAALQ